MKSTSLHKRYLKNIRLLTTSNFQPSISEYPILTTNKQTASLQSTSKRLEAAFLFIYFSDFSQCSFSSLRAMIKKHFYHSSYSYLYRALNFFLSFLYSFSMHNARHIVHFCNISSKFTIVLLLLYASSSHRIILIIFTAGRIKCLHQTTNVRSRSGRDVDEAHRSRLRV